MRLVRSITGLLMVAVLLLCGTSLPAKAASGSISLSVSSKSVNIGDTITVTVSGTSDVEAMIQVSVSYSGEVEYTGPGLSSVILEPKAGGSDSASLTYKAISPGTVSFTASVTGAYDVATRDAISIGGASASVTVNNAASNNPSGGNPGGGNAGDGNADGGNTTANLSADNSLKSLTISPGTLSPAFKYSTTKYTASVGADVTSIAVDAKVSNAKATVESVTGNTNLQPGENTIKIVVKAENGTLATYTIVVNRGGTAAEEPEETDPEENVPETQLPVSDIMFNGVPFEVSATLPEEEMPEEFTKTTTTYGDQEVEVYSFPYENLMLFYLKPMAAEGEEPTAESGFYFYNTLSQEFFPYINITVGQKYALILPTSYAGGLPEGCQEASFAIGDFVVNGCQPMESTGDTASEFYLVYCVDKNGTAGWYQYDTLDESLQRYVARSYTIVEEEEPEENNSAMDAAYAELKEKYDKEKASSAKIIAILIFVLVVAVIVIVNILIFGRKRKDGGHKKKQDKDIDYIDFDDL